MWSLAVPWLSGLLVLPLLCLRPLVVAVLWLILSRLSQDEGLADWLLAIVGLGKRLLRRLLDAISLLLSRILLVGHRLGLLLLLESIRLLSGLCEGRLLWLRLLDTYSLLLSIHRLILLSLLGRLLLGWDVESLLEHGLHRLRLTALLGLLRWCVEGRRLLGRSLHWLRLTDLLGLLLWVEECRLLGHSLH
jgi:hypothetical protein